MPSSKDIMNEKCPSCGNVVFYAEKIMFMSRLWHRGCLRCVKCNKVVESTKACVYDSKPYCPRPCYINMHFTKGYNRAYYK